LYNKLLANSGNNGFLLIK